jgi:hypothetical protein
MLKAELQTLAAQRFLTWQAPHDERAMLDFAEYIPSGQRMHLSGYQELHKAHLAQATSRTPGKAKSASSSNHGNAEQSRIRSVFPLVNLMQTPGMFNASYGVTPALLRQSRLFSLDLSRPLLSIEHFLVQGIPIPELLLPQSAMSQFCPFGRSVLHLTNDTERRRLTGNSMHLWQVGSALMLCLAELADLSTLGMPP